MRGRFIGFAAVAVLAASLQTHAEDVSTAQSIRLKAPRGISDAFYSCIGKAGSDKDKLSDCIDVEKKAQDVRLNKAYNSLMAHIDEKSKASLRAAERAWLDFNDKSITAQTSIGASGQINDLDVAESELFRYCLQANTLEHYLFGIGY
ncbi:lysozyme inhibitor LprI family protein [Luteibacter sp. 22Crub2.1]|uniref:lysozyme inhibitor LprI family protein n=1 Tax=Luteibacter sp. 22Crub2.1 TaxID=1283288 RepID=UPI0009A5CC33|nr:lysozyme inhibitor LprI family protein [Luteibacter sp. 22Crub2.1]SKB47611.1 Uncharacterized protein conserved in bacteria [Luteibacter sp. 22Crub2.1]